jgi:3',5'-cyclic AMP phosphodiesterase CpdA
VTAPGVLVGDAAVLAVSTVIDQGFARSAGRVGAEQRATIDGIADDHATRTVVVAQHHAPVTLGGRARDWIGGLLDHHAVADLLRRRPHVHVLAGHTHRRRDVSFEGRPQVFTAPAVADHPAPLRLYRAERGTLVPADPR